jgi:hypothetical protein
MPLLLDDFGVDNRHDDVLEESQRHETPLAIGKPVVLAGERHAGEDLCGVDEVEAMPAQVVPPLALAPREFELYSQLYIRRADDATLDIVATRAGAGDRPDG